MLYIKIIFILILFPLQILKASTITNVETSYLDDIIYDNFNIIEKQQLINGLQGLPKYPLLTLRVLVKEIRSRIVSILPLCLIYGLINLVVNDETNYSKINYNILLTILGRDILLSCVRYFIDTDILFALSFGVLTLIDVLVPLFIYYNNFVDIIATQYLTESQQHKLLLFIILSYTLTVVFRCKTRKQSNVAIKEYKYNLTKNPKLDIINNIFTIKDCKIFLAKNTANNKFDNIIEKFYKWIANHKNDICLNELTNIIYKPCIKDKSNTSYTDNDLIDILNKYQLGNYKNSLFYNLEFGLKFQLIEHNKSLTSKFIALALQREGVTLIEAYRCSIETSLNNYQYIGIVNNRSCCYLFFAMELNLDHKQYPVKITDIICQSLFQNNTNYSATYTVAMKLISINSFLITNLIDYLGGTTSKVNIYKISAIIE
jgi:hypothetical protein